MDTTTSKLLSSDRHLAAAIGKNTVFGVLASGAQLGTRFITIPIVIYHLGLGGYGIWSIIMVTAAYMRFGSAGIKSAFQKYVAEATSSGDYQTANQRVSTGSISMLVLSLLALLPVTIFSRKLAYASGVPPRFLASAAASIVILTSAYVVSNFGAAFEAIVMGGHRIDLTRKCNAVLSICEAIAIIVVLHFGYGLLAMTLVMGTSEVVYIHFCWLVSRRVVPQMQIRLSHFTSTAFPELLRFAGSYQLVNVLELLYGAVLPIVLLKFFGAESAGVAAVAGRLVTASLIAQDALLLPILSGGTVIFTSGSVERIRLFLSKSFKVNLATSLPPLAFVSAFGANIIFAWTGQADPRFRTAIWLIALSQFLRALSLLQLILYRASGKALLDNIRQVLRIIVILVVAFCGRSLGFDGVLAGMAFAESVGVIFMFFAMATTFHSFSAGVLALDSVRITAATAVTIGAGVLAGMMVIPFGASPRLMAAAKVVQISIACLVAAWPAATLTKTISDAEKRTILDTLFAGRRRALAASE